MSKIEVSEEVLLAIEMMLDQVYDRRIRFVDEEEDDVEERERIKTSYNTARNWVTQNLK